LVTICYLIFIQSNNFNFYVQLVFKPRHFNVQLQNKFGAPLTIGLKIIPKVFSRHGESDVVKGFDLVIHSELWLCNFTSLPISFGAPSEQVFSKTNDKSLSRSSNQTVKSSILNAENALLELSSILEFGDKGHSFIGDSDDQSNLGEIISIPSQKNDELVGKCAISLSFIILFFHY